MHKAGDVLTVTHSLVRTIHITQVHPINSCHIGYLNDPTTARNYFNLYWLEGVGWVANLGSAYKKLSAADLAKLLNLPERL